MFLLASVLSSLNFFWVSLILYFHICDRIEVKLKNARVYLQVRKELVWVLITYKRKGVERGMKFEALPLQEKDAKNFRYEDALCSPFKVLKEE